MNNDFTHYSGLLKTEKWLSKLDFIYRLKFNCDCSQERHRKFLQSLYSMQFSQVKKDQNGKIFIQ
jgi:redox-regulated HSP33 family molecular chaperone